MGAPVLLLTEHGVTISVSDSKLFPGCRELVIIGAMPGEDEVQRIPIVLNRQEMGELRDLITHWAATSEKVWAATSEKV